MKINDRSIRYTCALAGALILAMSAPAATQAPAAAGQKLAPLPLVLPQPVFEGTPQNLKVPNLEKPRYKARAPFLAPEGVKNVARRKPVVGSDMKPIVGDLAMITDGERSGRRPRTSWSSLPGKHQITVDLGAPTIFTRCSSGTYHTTPRVYFDVVLQVADDAGFTKNVRTVLNNDHDNTAGLGAGQDKNYVETSEGRLVDAKGAVARYVRLYSNGNNANDLNGYVEVEAGPGGPFK